MTVRDHDIGLEVELFGKLIRDRAVREFAELRHEVPVHQLAAALLEHAAFPHGVAYLAAQARAVFQSAGEDPRSLVTLGDHAEGDAQVAVLVGVHREVAVCDIGEGEHPAVSAFVAFAGGLQRRNDAVVDQQLHLAFGDFAQTSVGAEGAVRTAAARPLRHRTVRHLPRKGEGARHGAGQTQTLKRSRRQEGRQQLIGADRFTPARHLKNGRFRAYRVDMRHLATELVKALNKLAVGAVPGHGRTERASPRSRIRLGQVRVLHRQDAGASTQVGGHAREVTPGELRGNRLAPPHRAFARGLPAQTVHEQPESSPAEATYGNHAENNCQHSVQGSGRPDIRGDQSHERHPRRHDVRAERNHRIDHLHGGNDAAVQAAPHVGVRPASGGKGECHQQKKDEHRCVSFAAGFSTVVGDSKRRADAPLKGSSIAKLACRRYLQQTSFFGVTNLEVKLLTLLCL